MAQQAKGPDKPNNLNVISNEHVVERIHSCKLYADHYSCYGNVDGIDTKSVKNTHKPQEF